MSTSRSCFCKKGILAEALELFAGSFQRAVPRIMTWVGANFPTYHHIFVFPDVSENLQGEKDVENVRGREGTKNLFDVPQRSKDWK